MFYRWVADADEFLATRRARMVFTAGLLTVVPNFNGCVAGMAALGVLGLLAVSVPGLLTGVEPLAAAWWIAVALMVLQVAQIVLWAPFAWRRGLGDMVRGGRIVARGPSTKTNAVVEVRNVFERVAAAGFVLTRELDGPAADVVLASIATAGALVTADVLLRGWIRRRERRRRQNRSAADRRVVRR